MADRATELRAILEGVRARWMRRALLRSWALGAVTAAGMVGVGLLAIALLAHQGVPLLIVVMMVGALVGVSLAFAVAPARRPPSDRQVARFIEEQAGHLDEVLVTAVDKSTSQAGPVVDLLVADAIRAARNADLGSVVPPDSVQRAGLGALVGTAVFLAAMWFFAPFAARAVAVAGAYVWPSHYAIAVSPGSIKVREGKPVTITATVHGMDGGITPRITVGRGDAARSASMAPGTAADQFTITLNNITTSFPYVVSAGAATSAEFAVEVIRPIRVTRIDVTYDYAAGAGLASHTEQDGGDIFAPAGTKVRLSVTADKPIAKGALALDDGQAIAMSGHNQVMAGEFTVAKDGSYRVTLDDVDGLSNEGGVEYFIRTLNDRPPDVRIVRPAGDKRVSPLEEVVIEAKADDDYGIKSLELVVKSAAGTEKVIPLGRGSTPGATASGEHTVYLEDLRVAPGDVVTYYARATDVGKGRRSTESRSDIFFLEVKPYEEEFVASESQGGSGMQEQQTGLEELIAQQKDIMAATWKLDARARRGGAAALSPRDVRAVGEAQGALRNKTSEVAAEIAGQLAAQRRRLGPQTRGLVRPDQDPLPKAIDAMGRAAGELERVRVAPALPYEEEALAELLKAAADVRRRQVAMQQARGGGSNGNREQPDLSTLFDQELRKRQATNYEQQSTTEDAKAGEQDAQDPLAQIRELARRQEALSQQQRDLANQRDPANAAEMRRQLDKLTRDQEALRKQAEELSRQMQSAQGASGAQGTGSQGANSARQQLKDATEQMRQAAGDLRNQDPKQASANGAKAGAQLRGLEQQLQSARPDERRRAMGDLQLEARQLADAQRRLGSEASRAAAGAAGEDTRRRLAGEQERLADRAQRLGQSVKDMASAATEPGAKQAIGEAGKALDAQNVPGRMRESAQALRGSTGGSPAPGAKDRGVEAEQIARALDGMADQLGAAGGDRDAESAKLSDQLGRTRQLRDRLDRLQRSMEQLAQGNGAAKGDVERQLQEAQQLAQQMSRDMPGFDKNGTTPEQWQRSLSSPGTEAFKQDFAKWESLKKNLQVALERSEAQLSDQLRAHETRERLNAGRHDGVSDTYRSLVERYYQSLAAPRAPKAPKAPGRR